MTDETYTVFTPYGIVRATFPEDAGIAMEGHEDAIAAVRRAILASIDERGMTTTPEALDPDRFVQWCQGPDSAITIVAPVSSELLPDSPPNPEPEDADMQAAEAMALDAVSELSAEEHKRCMQAYEDYYHKVAAETSPKLWAYVWAKALNGAVSGGSAINIVDGVEELPGMRAAIAAATSPMERIALVKAMKAAQAAWEAEPKPEPKRRGSTGARGIEGASALLAVKDFIALSQRKAIAQGMKGEEADYFIDKMLEVKKTIETMPATYGQDGKGMQATAYLHYFKGGTDAYITEKDQDGGVDQAFGLADLFGDGGELGYISIREWTDAGAELDLHWTPKTLAQIRSKGEPEPEPKPAADEWEPFVYKGLKVFPTNMRAGDGSVTRRWQVQTPENAEREQRGERQIGGDALASTREAAIERAEEMLREVERRKGFEDQEKSQAEADKKFAEEAAARRTAAGLLDFVKGMTPANAARALKTLEKQISVRGKFKPTYEHMRDLVLTEGYRVNQDDTRLANSEGSFFTSADFPVTAFNYAKFLAEKANAATEEKTGPYPYRYALVNRPADLGTIPKGVKYTVEPRPAAGQPHADMARHGILTTERELTTEELKAFELAPLVDGDDLGALAEAIARGMSEYAAGYLEQASEDPETFAQSVRDAARRSASGVTYSIGDPALLVQMVRDKLAAMIPADPKPDSQLGLDTKFLTEVVDGKHPAMLEPELADDIEAAIMRHPDDKALQALGERAIIAYSNSLMRATGG